MVAPSAIYQQTKRVVDPVEGTYQTVLTIDPSVGQSGFAGTYSCTVENARGISLMTVIIPGNGELILFVRTIMMYPLLQLLHKIQLHCHNI